MGPHNTSNPTFVGVDLKKKFGVIDAPNPDGMVI
jgi:hypothetical protein